MSAREIPLIPEFCDLHVDVWEKMDGIIWHNSWTTANKVLAYDETIYSCGIGTAALCLLLQEAPDGKTNAAEIDLLIGEIREIKSRAKLKSEHLIHLRVEFLDSDALDTAMRLVEKHSDILKIISLVDHIPGYRQYKNAEQLYAAYQRRFGWSKGDLDAVSARRSRKLSQRQRHMSELIAELVKHPVLIFSHDDQTEEEVLFAVASGVSCIEFPLTLAAADSARHSDVPFLLGAPNLLRGGSSFGNESAERLIRDGGQVFLSGDYLPHSIFLALAKFSGAFADDALVEKFINYAVYEPAKLLERVGITHDTLAMRRVEVTNGICQLHRVSSES